MAAYATFKHVELYNIGKAKKRVLRPPGGGSSDIFGTDMPQTPRSVKNHMASNIFSAEKNSAVKNNGDGPRRAQKNVDSYSRLFGEPERPITPGKNHMRSNIPFGSNTEAVHHLLTNGNGHYTNSKSGSVSSASSSVSSSTENLKMNGISRSVFRNVSNMAQELGPDSMCLITPTKSSEPEATEPVTLDVDHSCIDTRGVDSALKATQKYNESGTRDIGCITRKDGGNNPEHPYSFSDMMPAGDKNSPTKACVDTNFDESKDSRDSRNPITGCGLNGDGVGGLKPKKLKNREGNPVTGEGYKPGATDYQQPNSMNNSQVIKNRVPPGGYSSGLW